MDRIQNIQRTKAVYKSLGIVILMIVFGGSTIPSLAQDIQFSEYRTFPLYLNPASTGKIDQQRFALKSRNQWVGIQGAFNTIGMSYDYNWKKYKSGVGLVVIQDETSGGGFSTFTAGGLYSYHLQINDNLFFHTGLRASFVQESLNPDKLIFTDQLQHGGDTYEVFDDLAHYFMDFSWGNILYYSDEEHEKHMWLGIAFDHLNKPEISFNQFDGKLPVKFTLHGGGEHRLSKNEQGFPEQVLTYTVLYKAQLKWDQAEFGASYIKRIPHKKRTMTEWKKTTAKFEPSYKQNFGVASDAKTPLPLVYGEFGLKYRGLPIFKRYQPGYSNNEAVIVMFAFSYYKLKIIYTFDWTISTLRYSNSGGAHELSMIYDFVIPVSDKKLSRQKARKQKALFD